MNSRYFLTADSPCNIGNSVAVSSILQTGEERTATAPPSNPRGRPSRNSSSAPPILIKLAMKISRARWYSFLRRVFHYQNGSGSDLGPNPFNSGRWMLLEFVCLVVQISATVYTLIVSRGENPVWPMRIWVSGYVFGCFISLVLLHCRYRVVSTFIGDPNQNLSDVEQQQQQSSEESRNLQKFGTWVELLFAIWFVMGNIWVFDSRFGSYIGAPKLHVLCVSLLAWNAVSYSFPFILFVFLCCCVPFLSGLVRYNINTASLDRGATDEQIAGLPCWKYKEDHDVELGDHEYPECCICLAKYREKEEMRELPCNHIFHRKCVDQWLKILSCCPLCKQQINK